MNEQDVSRDAENGKDPARLERDIDRTRASLGRTVDELERRLSPGELLDQALGMAREHGGEFATNLGRSLRNNPVPAVLTGVGVAWMMASSNEPRAAAGYDVRSGPDSDASGRLERGMHSARSAASAATDRASRAKDSVKHSIDAVGDSASDVAEQVRMHGREIRHGFDHLMQEQPLIVGAVGMAIGAALGAAFPRTESEDRLLGEASDSAMGAARDRAVEAYDEVKETTADVVASARDKSDRSESEDDYQTTSASSPGMPGETRGDSKRRSTPDV